MTGNIIEEDTKVVFIEMVVPIKSQDPATASPSPEIETGTFARQSAATCTTITTVNQSHGYQFNDSRSQQRNRISEERWKQILQHIKEAITDVKVTVSTDGCCSPASHRRRKPNQGEIASRSLRPEYSTRTTKKESKHFLNFLSCWAAVFD